ncbi:hypothetical protein [Bradyrhizobium sp. Tv2a-2]|uniref:hypothetical protein n=1 Tax=Bradyrhizobium sp. Tv2a-2 TaxID=113395 RepID=UPI0012EC34E0|nr:hypothetical protein [Bradyrhizobium sp. Tv2a-2]
MNLENPDRIPPCLTRIADLRKRADAETNPVAKAELRGLELVWLAILDSYMLVLDEKYFLNGAHRRRVAAVTEKSAKEGIAVSRLGEHALTDAK